MKSAGVMEDIELAKFYLNDAVSRFERVAKSETSKANVRKMVGVMIGYLDSKVAEVEAEAKDRHERADRIARWMCWSDRYMPFIPKSWRMRCLFSM